jgi:IS5 family transposase
MDGKYLGFCDYEQTIARKRTKRQRFLVQMEAVVPSKSLIDLRSPTNPRPATRVDVPPSR